MSNESSERICEYCQRGSKPWLKNGIWLHEGGVSCAVPPAEADAQREPELERLKRWAIGCRDAAQKIANDTDFDSTMRREHLVRSHCWESLIREINTRSRPTVAAPEDCDKLRQCLARFILAHSNDVYLWLAAHAVFAKDIHAGDINKAHAALIQCASDMQSASPTVEAAEIRRQAFDEAIAIVRDHWLAAYPLDIFPEPPPPPVECVRDLIAAAMGRHMAMRLIEQFEAARDAAPTPSKNSGDEAK